MYIYIYSLPFPDWKYSNYKEIYRFKSIERKLITIATSWQLKIEPINGTTKFRN